jgi:hypothetical protein
MKVVYPTNDLWQARVNKGWRFYFKITDDTYRIENHPPSEIAPSAKVLGDWRTVYFPTMWSRSRSFSLQMYSRTSSLGPRSDTDFWTHGLL